MLLSGRAFALVFGAPLLGALVAFAVPVAAGRVDDPYSTTASAIVITGPRVSWTVMV